LQYRNEVVIIWVMPILIVEDDKKLSNILRSALKGERYSVDTAFDGEEAALKAKKNSYSMILLDILLPKKDGFVVCKELREHQIQTPIIMLTARGTIEDRVSGLNAGADDYMVKPFGTEELFARIRTVLRRRKTTDSDIRKVGRLVMDKKKHEVTLGGKILDLTPKEYKLLDVLITHPGEAIKRRQLIDHAWGPQFVETHNELNVHIKYLRTKIEKGSKKPAIHTIRGVGFVLKE
jgi:two-component system copper resistance phosphate regulon response regulator CusR